MPPHSLNSDSSAVIDSHRKLRPRSGNLFSSLSIPPTAFADPLGVPESTGACAVDWEEADMEYALFLQHLRVDGNSYVAEIPVGGCGPPLRIKYEEVRESSFPACQTQRQRRRHSSSGSMKTGAAEAKKVCERKSSPAESLSRCEDQYSSIDKDYQIFLNNIRSCGGTMVLEWRNNVTVYEQEPKEDEDVEVQPEEEGPTEEDEVKAIETEEPEEKDAICPIQMEGASFDKPLVISLFWVCSQIVFFLLYLIYRRLYFHYYKDF